MKWMSFFVGWVVPTVRVAVAAETLPAPLQVFITQRCAECHDAETKKGGLNLVALGTTFDDADTFARWVKIHDRVRNGEMPPAKKPRPDSRELDGAMSVLQRN